MLMIAAVIAAASAMQAAGGLDYLVRVAERLLRRHPEHVTILSPLVTYAFTFVAGTGHVAYSVLPVIAEVARETRIRPRAPAGHCCDSVAAGHHGESYLGGHSGASRPSCRGRGELVRHNEDSCACHPRRSAGGRFFSRRVGKELMDDPEYQRRVREGMIKENDRSYNREASPLRARLSVAIFVATTLLIVLFGSFGSLRPHFGGEPLGMPAIIEMLMLASAAVIMLLCRIDGISPTRGSVFIAGMQAVIAIFGIAWLGDTFINGNMTELTGSVKELVTGMPWLFCVALFVMSILLYSQAATVRAVMPLGVALGLSPWLLIALYPAVNGYFFHPQLSHSGGCYQLRQHRHHADRPLCAQSFVYDAGHGVDSGGCRNRAAPYRPMELITARKVTENVIE